MSEIIELQMSENIISSVLSDSWCPEKIVSDLILFHRFVVWGYYTLLIVLKLNVLWKSTQSGK